MTTTTTTTASAVSTSRSDDSGAVRPVSKSAGSAGSSQLSQRSISSLYEERGHGQLRVFDYEELQGATAEFSRAQKLGEGGFGSVYKGFIRAADGKGDRVPVAVKKLNQRGMQESKTRYRSYIPLFIKQAKRRTTKFTLTNLNVEYLESYKKELAVSIKTMDDRLHVQEEKYDVQKTMSTNLLAVFKKSLLNLLNQRRPLDRMGLFGGQPVIYRDFKTSNILLDKDFRAKLSDFGLAREGPTGANTHVSTAVVGTQGYAAPEYIDSGHLTAKSDVWSFGVVLYEILTGRRSLDRNKPAAEQKLLEWVVQFPPDSRNFRVIMDPRLRGEYSVKAAREIAKLADSCLLKNAKERPTMSEGGRGPQAGRAGARRA
ncbi:unnamed protein product [Miscanthus lutarioriparius]|uniref:Protein kinase domain-containing protein n=1 Tax=Miscanthus lutarioriparius TaxID=422564 RepID=A0A811MZB8_9POAL|nr:unnamed protein product [Miscanthus lutarioriparius]